MLVTGKERDRGFHHADSALFLGVGAGYMHVVGLRRPLLSL